MSGSPWKSPNFDQLLNALADYAEPLITKQGHFVPMGCWIDDSGGVNVFSHFPGEQADTRTILAGIREALVQIAQTRPLAAGGLTYDSTVREGPKSEKRDAIAIEMQDQSGETAVVWLPYRRRADGACDWGKPIGQPLDAPLF